MFFNTKISKVGWYKENDMLIHPSLSIEPKMQNNFGCPSISSMNNRIFNIYPQFSAKIMFGFKDNVPYYEYEIDKQMNTTQFVHDLIKSRVYVRQEKDKVVLQITDDKLFVTNAKRLEMIIFQPDIANYENCYFVNGSFYPYGWIRSLNAAYVQINNKEQGIVHISSTQPYFNLLFSNKVSLKEITPNEEILKYASNSIGMVNYHKNVKPVMERILKRRPKKFLFTLM
jgi:hypothetical protein